MVWSHETKTCAENKIMFRVRISGLHSAKCKGIISFFKALSQRNNKNASSINNIQAKKRSSKAFNFLMWSHPEITLPSQLVCSIPDIIHVLCFELFIFLSCFVFFFQLSYNCQIFEYQITFSKIPLSMSNKGCICMLLIFMVRSCFALKLDVPWGHIETKKTLLLLVF